MTTVFHLKSRWESTLKYNITILTCPWPSSYWSPWSWWTSTFDIARFTSAKYVTLIMKSLDRWKITKTLKMRTNKPVVAPKRLPQNGGKVLHQLSALRERGDPGRSSGLSVSLRSLPQWTQERVPHNHSHEENFQCRSGCWGGPPPLNWDQLVRQKLITNSVFLGHTISSVSAQLVFKYHQLNWTYDLNDEDFPLHLQPFSKFRRWI